MRRAAHHRDLAAVRRESRRTRVLVYLMFARKRHEVSRGVANHQPSRELTLSDHEGPRRRENRVPRVVSAHSLHDPRGLSGDAAMTSIERDRQDRARIEVDDPVVHDAKRSIGKQRRPLVLPRLRRADGEKIVLGETRAPVLEEDCGAICGQHGKSMSPRGGLRLEELPRRPPTGRDALQSHAGFDASDHDPVTRPERLPVGEDILSKRDGRRATVDVDLKQTPVARADGERRPVGREDGVRRAIGAGDVLRVEFREAPHVHFRGRVDSGHERDCLAIG